MAERSLKLLIAGDASGALKALGSTGDASEGLGSKLKTMGKFAAAGFAAAGAATAVFLKGAIEAAAESQKITKVTEQIVKSTGGAAKISADEIGKLATALSNKTGIDDEAIQSAQNLILTFKNVRNEVGKGNDIFSRASGLALDLSTVMGTDASSAAMQLGKALDNPTKGVTALARSGVSFTAQQKEQIKTLMESNKTLEAQKIILKEVESQVGGTAAAQASATDKAKVAFGNLQEQIGMYFLPIVEKVSNFLVATFIPKLSELANKYGPAVGAAFKWLGEMMKPVFEWLQVNVPKALRATIDAINVFVEWVRSAWAQWGEDITRVARQVWDTAYLVVSIYLALTIAKIKFFIEVIQTLWSMWGDNITRVLRIAFETIIRVVGDAMTVIQGIIKAVTALIHGDWGKAWDSLKQVFVAWVDGMSAIFRMFGSFFVEQFKMMFEFAGKIVGGGLSQIDNIIRTGARLLWEASKFVFDKLLEGFIASWELTIKWASGLPDKIKGWLTGAGKWLYDAGVDIVKGMWNGIKKGFAQFFEGNSSEWTSKVRTIEKTARTTVKSKSPSMVFYDLGTDIVDGLALGITDRIPAATAAATAMGQATIAVTGSWAGEAARNGAALVKDTFESMAGEMARNGKEIYKPLVAAMAGESARNGNAVAKPLFASMAGEAARNGASQIAGALRIHLEKEAAALGYDLGKVMSEEITGSLEEVIGNMSKRISGGLGTPGAGAGGAAGVAVGGGTPGGGGAGGVAPTVGDLYGRFGGTYGNWAKNQLGELADWNQKWNPAGSPQVRVFAPNPVSGGTLLDANGNPVYLDDANAVRDALSNLVPQMANGGVVSSPTLAMIGEAGPEAIVPLSSSNGYGTVTVNVSGSVISERDLVDSIRKALYVEQQRGKVLVP